MGTSFPGIGTLSLQDYCGAGTPSSSVRTSTAKISLPILIATRVFMFLPLLPVGLFNRNTWDSSHPAYHSAIISAGSCRGHGDLFSWHWNPELARLLWGRDSFLLGEDLHCQDILPNFNCHMGVHVFASPTSLKVTLFVYP
uniref:Uncharacterized protein n=1 Tax=Rousettus aegyptiacus TaxID=9407 RepID=A0A7J8FKR2_ROUAE|nr:hypothetical protein HJG63_012108 [Rousettus aegyptiacus]